MEAVQDGWGYRVKTRVTPSSSLPPQPPACTSTQGAAGGFPLVLEAAQDLLLHIRLEKRQNLVPQNISHAGVTMSQEMEMKY